MANVKFRFNLDAEQVELVYNDKVIETVEKDIFESWVTAYNKKHGFVKPEPVEEKTTEEGKQNDNEEKSKEESAKESDKKD